jgi:hypothetical protein
MFPLIFKSNILKFNDSSATLVECRRHHLLLILFDGIKLPLNNESLVVETAYKG